MPLNKETKPSVQNDFVFKGLRTKNSTTTEKYI